MEEERKDFMAIFAETICKWVGTIGTVLSLIAYIIVIYILTLPASEYMREPSQLLWFAILNAGMGLLIAILLGIQGSVFSVNRHKDLYLQFHKKKAKERKKKVTENGVWIGWTIKTVLTRLVTFAFTTFASWEFMTMAGQDPTLIGLAFANLGLFLSSGMLALNKVYNLYEKSLFPSYEIQLENRSKTIGQEGCQGDLKDDSLREQQDI